VITVNPDKWPKVNYAGALAFANWLVSPEIQKPLGTLEWINTVNRCFCRCGKT